MENNVQTLKNDVPTLKKSGYITEVVTPKTLNNNILIAKYVTQVGVASKIKFEDAEEGAPEDSKGDNDSGVDATPKADAPKEPVVEETPKDTENTPATPEVTTTTPEESTKTPEDEIVVDEQDPVVE